MTNSQRWFLLIAALVSCALLYLLEPILFPFLAALLLAYLWDPVVDKLEARGMSRTLGVSLIFCIFALVTALLLLWLLPMLGQQVDMLGKRLPIWIDRVTQDFIPQVYAYVGMEPPNVDWSKVKESIQENWKSGGGMATNVLSQLSQSGLALLAWLANVVLIPVVLFYLLRDWDLMVARIHNLLPVNIKPQVSHFARESDEVLGAFIKGQLLVMLSLGIIYATGLSLVGLDLALLIGLLAGLANIVPYMGFIVGILIATVAAFMQFHDFYHLFLVAVVFGVGQALEGMVLTPWLVGDKIGMHPVAVIFAVMAGGQLFGFTGVLLALPVAAVLMVLLRHIYDSYKDSRFYDGTPKE